MRVLDSPASSSPTGQGRVIITTPAPAGSGASILAAALAQRAHARQLRTVLMDLDPASGGIDLLVGAERVAGSRWADLAHVRDPLPPNALLTLLPTVPDASGVHVLSMSRNTPANSEPALVPSVVRAVLTSARREADLVLLDAPPRCHDDRVVPWDFADAILLVTGGSVRAYAAAQRAAEHLASVRSRLGLVVRAPGPRRDHDAVAIADALNIPLVAEVISEVHIDRQIDDAMAPGSYSRSPIARTADRLLSQLIATPTVRVRRSV